MESQLRALDPSTGEPIVELVPHTPPDSVERGRALRIVGPGRREREYLGRVAALEASLVRELAERAVRERELAAREGELAALECELALAALCERGSRRAADRLERDNERLRREREAALGAHNRMILALGALQRENELLREELALSAGRERAVLPARVEPGAARARDAAANAPRARSWWSWLRR